MKGKVIDCTNDVATLGLENGTSITVPRGEIGFPIATGTILDIYEHTDGTYKYAKRHEKKSVNKVSYILFAMFLGGLGAHKFYSGKTFKGVLYLVFCWTFIPAFIAFIEGILAIGKPTDEYGNFEVD